MPRFDMFRDQQRRHLVHIYASLRECIADEVEYDREPEFAPLDDETQWAVSTMIYQQITELMFAAHEEEAAKIEAEVEAMSVVERWREPDEPGTCVDGES
jgi:hypothetical protein